jgi:lipopolysaccharide export system protein LptC
MRFSGSSLFPLAVLALLAAFTFWMEHASQGEAPAGRLPRHDADFWVDGMTAHRYDVKGAIQHSLTARRLEHFPDDDSTRVDDPHLDYFADHPATATAKTAWLDKKGKHVRLEGDVKVVRPRQAGELPTVISTSVLFVTPDDEYAYTKAPVTITQGQTVIHGAGGIEVNNKTHIAVLSGPVEGIIHRKRQ